MRNAVEHIHGNEGLVIFGEDIGQLVHGGRVVGTDSQGFAVGPGAFLEFLVQAVDIAQVHKEVDFVGMGRIAFADYRHGAVEIFERDVRLGKLVHDADVALVELIGFFDGPQRADPVAGFTVGFA